MILDAFNQVKSAPGIVWGLRANGGGMTRVAYDIMAARDPAETTRRSSSRGPKIEQQAISATMPAVCIVVIAVHIDRRRCDVVQNAIKCGTRF
jgi:hypothetical protein